MATSNPNNPIQYTHPMIFINLPVTSISLSKAFYASLGFTSDERFTTPETCMMKLSAHINVMLHDRGARFADFMPPSRRASNAHTHTEAILALSCERREEVDAWVQRAGKAGGTMDVGWRNEMVGADGVAYMYGRSFDDLDGHVWEVVWMHERAVENVEVLREEREERERERGEGGEKNDGKGEGGVETRDKDGKGEEDKGTDDVLEDID